MGRREVDDVIDDPLAKILASKRLDGDGATGLQGLHELEQSLETLGTHAKPTPPTRDETRTGSSEPR